MVVTKEQLLPYPQYAGSRAKFVQKVIDEKKIRRVNISDKVSGVFENHLTVWFQIQEMIHAERIEEEQYIEEMLEVYNDLLPLKNELSMTLFIEIPDQTMLREFNKTIVGIENNVKLLFGGHSVTSYEPSDEEEEDADYTQSVHYLHFPFTEEQKAAFLEGSPQVTLKIEHPNYVCETELGEQLIAELQKQLRS